MASSSSSSSSSSSASSSSVGFPLSGNPQSSEAAHLYPVCNGVPTRILSDAECNRELSNFFHDFDFCLFMRGGACEDAFVRWYECMHRAVRVGGDRANCSDLAGTLRNCVFANQSYYKPLFDYLNNRNHQ